MRTLAALALVVLAGATAAVAAPQDTSVPASRASHPSGRPPAVAKATRFLRGRRFSTHQSSSGSIAPILSTIDRHYDFCPRSRFRYESTFLNAGLDEVQQDIRAGRWKVTRARLSRAGFGFARARLISDAGDRGAVTISATRRGYFVDGLVAEVTRSPVCKRN